MSTKGKNAAIASLKAGVCALALTGMMMASPAISASTTSPKTTAQVTQSSQDQTARKRLEILEEAVSAVAETHKALKALDNGKKKEALADLEHVTGKLEIILAREPSLKLAPVDVSATTSDIYADADDVKIAVEKARNDLADGRAQDARHLLEHLASETVINVTNIPLAAYPAAIKEAAKLIDSGKTKEAKQLLQTALNNMVVTQTIIPLPVIRAEYMLSEAEKLAENKTRKADESKHLSELLTNAETQIKFAEILGYGQKKDFGHFYDEIAKIRGETADGKSGTGFFDKIKQYMTLMKTDSQPKGSEHKTTQNQ